MAKFLKNFTDVEELHRAIQMCKSDVYLIKNDGSEQFNLKSALSEFLGLGRLAETHGDEYELFCQNAADESIIMKFYREHEENK